MSRRDRHVRMVDETRQHNVHVCALKTHLRTVLDTSCACRVVSFLGHVKLSQVLSLSFPSHVQSWLEKFCHRAFSFE